jgi:DNA-binding MarR family transcriptional regulator
LKISTLSIFNLSSLPRVRYRGAVHRPVEGLHQALAADAWGRIWEFFVRNRRVYAAAAAAHGLNPGVMHALLSLDAGEAKPMRSVAEACQCDASNATWLVDRLEERGLVERRTTPVDRRLKTVALTEAGVALVEALRAEVLRPPEAILALTDEELDVLRAVFAKLAAVADEVPAASP